MATTSLSLPRIPQLSRVQTIGLVVGVVGIILLVVGFFANGDGGEEFLRGYLYGYYYVMSLPIGCLGALMVYHLASGTWGFTIRRMLEAGAMTWPIMGVLFIPIALGAFNFFGHEEWLYHWADPDVVATDPIIKHKEPWLNPPFFVGRAVIYFVVFSTIAFLLRTWSLAQDRTGDPKYTKRMHILSGVGVAVFVIGITFLAFDWTMSLDPHWFSTIYGAHYMVSSVLLTLSFMVVMLAQIHNTDGFREFFTTRAIHDIGKFMYAFTIIWTYMSYGQYVIIWSGDIAEFTPWYLHRTTGGWEYFVYALIVLSFFLPFFALLSRRNKQNIRTLSLIAGFIMFVRLVDVTWIVLPNFHETIFGTYWWIDLAAPLGLLGLWVGLFVWNLQRAPIVALNDPNYADMLMNKGHH
jgi:hypothetical protein